MDEKTPSNIDRINAEVPEPKGPERRPKRDYPAASARRGGMTLVRLREGVYATGDPVKTWMPEPERVLHIIPDESVLLSAADKEYASAPDPGSVESCCGAIFAPETLEEVPWGTKWPHDLCVRKSRWPRSYIERVFHREEDKV